MAIQVQPAHHALAERIAAQAAKNPSCRVVGLCGSQGSGKSTTAAILEGLLKERDLRVATLSIDDLYLTREARTTLARQVHPLLQTRGVPGTHDVSLGLQTITALRQGGAPVALPSFDKAKDNRRPRSEWKRVAPSVHVVLFEGWCVGAAPQSAQALKAPVNALERDEDPAGLWRRYVNDALANAYRALFAQIDYLILLAAPDFDVVYGWRLEQERELRRRVAGEENVSDLEAGAGLMSDAQLLRFVSHYERLTRHILEEMPARADVVVRLDAGRRMTVERG